MKQYLLSTYAVAGQVPGAPTNPAEMQDFRARVIKLENEMDTTGAFVFGGGLKFYDPTATHVVHLNEDMTEGPLVEAQSQLAGFYIINAENDDAALSWAKKVARATNHPIEVRPFHATGFVKDSM